MFKKKSLFDIQLLIIIAIVIFLNLISLNMFFRVDFTKGNIYSLSKTSKNIVKNVDDKIIVKAYISENLPGQYANISRYTRDLLAEYKAYSKGKFFFQFINAKEEEKLKEEAEKNGIYPIQMQVMNNDKYEVRKVYIGLVLNYKDKKEIIPVVSSTEGLEYTLTSKVIKITAQQDKKVLVFDANSNLRNLVTLLQESYRVMNTDLENALDLSYSVLVFGGVKDSLSQTQQINLDQYIMNGGKVVFLQNKVNPDIQSGTASLIATKLFAMLDNYGIAVKNNIVADAECAEIGIVQRQGPFTFNVPVQYPFLINVHNVNIQNIIVKNLNQMQFAFMSEVDAEKTKANLQITPLLFSSENSGETLAPNFDLSYQKYINQDLKTMFTEKNKVLAALYKGSVNSYFKKDDIKDGNYVAKNDNAEIIFIGDNNFVHDNEGARLEGNMNLILNVTDYLSGNSDYISLRSRSIEYKPLKDLSNGMKKLVKWLNILLPMIILLIIGYITYNKQNNKRKMLRFKYE